MRCAGCGGTGSNVCPDYPGCGRPVEVAPGSSTRIQVELSSAARQTRPLVGALVLLSFTITAGSLTIAMALFGVRDALLVLAGAP